MRREQRKAQMEKRIANDVLNAENGKGVTSVASNNKKANANLNPVPERFFANRKD